jgi:hypothetical protein
MPWLASVGFFVNPRSLDAAPARAGAKSDGLFLLASKRVEPARGAHADLDRVGFKVVVLRLLRIGGHGNGLVANVFDLVDVAGLLERPARRVVADEFGAHDATRCMPAPRRDAVQCGPLPQSQNLIVPLVGHSWQKA